MRNIILGAVAGLVIGTAGALAYSQYVEDAKLADLQTQLDSANGKLAKAQKETTTATPEMTAASDQINQLVAANDDLKKQLDAAKAAPVPASPLASINPMTLMGMMRGMMRGGMQGQQRMFLLQTRLHLTPDQATKLKAAMEADDKARREAFQQRRNAGQNGGGPPNFQALAAANTFDQTLNSIMTPDQKAEYQQVQADEQASRAETSATVQMNQMAPLLQLTDTQKDQLSSALYQVQMSAPDPTTLMGNPNAAALVTAQAQATQAALAKVLTPDQQAIYQQQAQAVGNTGGGRGFGGGGNGGGGNGGNAAPAAPAATTTAAPATAATTPATTVTTPSTTTTTNSDGTTATTTTPATAAATTTSQ